MNNYHYCIYNITYFFTLIKMLQIYIILYTPWNYPGTCPCYFLDPVTFQANSGVCHYMAHGHTVLQ